MVIIIVHKKLSQEVDRDFDKLKKKDYPRYESMEKYYKRFHTTLHKIANR